jgi:glycosyltransferase involved in cell wall biosynthesis
MPTVSIIIPCYKQAHFLSAALESALGQTHPDVEVIVVDDGSPDDVAGVAAAYPAATYVRQENRGLPAARNEGFRRSRGEYVMFLDSDDRLAPTAVETHLRCFAAYPDSGFVVGEIDHMARDGSYMGSPRWPVRGTNHYEPLLRVAHVANTIAAMFRRAALDDVGLFDESLPAAEDYEMLLRVARTWPAAHHPDVVAHYRRYPNSMSRKGALMIHTTLLVLRRQWPTIEHDERLRAAYYEGQRYWRTVYGEVLIDELHDRAAQRDWRSVASGMLTLLRHRPVRVLEYATRRLIPRGRAAT